MAQIQFEYDGKHITLEFTRNSIKKMEARGFEFDKLSKMPVTMISKFFEGSLIEHHPEIRDRDAEKIFDSMDNKEALLEELIKMFGEAQDSLMKKGNLSWTRT